MKKKNESVSARDLLKFLYVLIPLGLLLLYVYYSDESDEKLMQQQGINTECVMVAYGEGRAQAKGAPNKVIIISLLIILATLFITATFSHQLNHCLLTQN